MKKLLLILLAVMLCFGLVACSTTDEPSDPVDNPDEGQVTTPENPVIRLSTTTSVNDSELLPYLQKEFEADTGYKLEITSAGTGAAIEKGTTGDADVLLVHAKDSEEEFINDGYGVERIPFMYNYFVIVGPAADPAGVKGLQEASEAFAAIAAAQAPFISRGDDSGTHKAELKIWETAGITPDPAVDTWYISAGAGMGAVINMASEQQAYTLTDKATYLSHELKDTLELLMEESEEKKNTYSMIAISPDKWPDTNIDGANAFIEWMLSDKATQLINEYGVEEYGQQLFFTIDDEAAAE